MLAMVFFRHVLFLYIYMLQSEARRNELGCVRPDGRISKNRKLDKANFKPTLMAPNCKHSSWKALVVDPFIFFIFFCTNSMLFLITMGGKPVGLGQNGSG